MSKRTVQIAPKQSTYNGQWACVFQTWVTLAGEEYLASEAETAALWFDAAAARRAGERALETLERTDRYPNMCEVW